MLIRLCQVVNITMGEVVAELTDFGVACAIADQLAEDNGHRHRFVVFEKVIRYQTRAKDDGNG
jgi:hypothetical protein